VPSHARALAAAGGRLYVRVVPTTLVEILVLMSAGTLALGLLGAFGGAGGAKLSAQRASWALTPGVASAQVTQANLVSTVCKHGWTSTVRPPTDYTNALKVDGMKAYGRAGSTSDYQEDHLISLELGGDPTDPRNLWPEPIERAKEVDAIEDALNEQVCSGELTLDEAQRRESEIKHTEG
jgi:hypothetical protein